MFLLARQLLFEIGHFSPRPIKQGFVRGGATATRLFYKLVEFPVITDRCRAFGFLAIPCQCALWSARMARGTCCRRLVCSGSPDIFAACI